MDAPLMISVSTGSLSTMTTAVGLLGGAACTPPLTSQLDAVVQRKSVLPIPPIQVNVVPDIQSHPQYGAYESG